MFRISLRNFFSLMLYCIPNTVLSVAILLIMNNIVSGKAMLIKSHQDIVFFSLIVVSFLLNVFVQKRIIYYSNRLIYENELRVMEKIKEAGMVNFEKVGSQRVYGAIEDMRMLVFLPGMLTTAITLVLTLVICIIYFFLVSIPSTLFVILLIMGIVGIYFMVNKQLTGKVQLLRQKNDNYFGMVDDVLKGFKELKMSSVRRRNMREKYLEPNREEVMHLENNVSNYLSVISLVSQYGLYLIIGVVIFILPQFKLLSAEQVSVFVLVLLFIRGPINSLTSMQAFFTKAMAANNRIRVFLKELDGLAVEQPTDLPAKELSPFNELRFDNISYRYPNTPKGSPDVLRGVSLTIRKGEVVFIVGGNGSGKSTFINILTGIYSPADGKVLMNGNNIDADLQGFREHISAVYSDHHLFSANYEDYALMNNEAYRSYLKMMELDAVVREDHEDAGRRKFSKGQSKRMGLIYALLENRDILVLDEWAADQDPHFRKFFYEQLIPRFKKQGKTVIAVTHDDSYFKQADRLIKFEYGRIVTDVKLTGSLSEMVQI